MRSPSSNAAESREVTERPNDAVPESQPLSSRPRRSARYDDAFLDEMRTRGDAPADRVIESLLEHHELGTARRLLTTLIENDGPLPDSLPPEMLEYLRASEQLEGSERAAIEAGQRLFAEHGLLVLMCLACYSLPAAYAAAKGVKVLHRTAYLEKRPAKRLFETTQMVVDVMTPGGLERGGRGVRTAQKVRLMHAMVRHMIQSDANWSADLGVPINQEDLAGTLMTFSWITLDGLDKLGVHLAPEARESYLAAWRAVGRLMGVDEELLPETVADAAILTERIQARQIGGSAEGRLMTEALLEMMKRNSGGELLGNMPAALMRHFLPAQVADFLGIPNKGWAHWVVKIAVALGAQIEHFAERWSLLESLARYFSIHFIQWMITVDLNGRRAAFEIPDVLARRWHLDPDTEPTFFERLERWARRVAYSVKGP